MTTLKQIQQDREFIELTPKQICWLIDEVEKLTAENEELHREGMIIYAMMEDGRAKEAAQRCFDILMKAFVEGKTLPMAADIIKEEFKL